jgi:hypothetical protein
MATTLADQALLAADSTFQSRVRASAMAAAVAIHSEAFTALTPQRDAFGKQILNNNPAGIAIQLANSVATDATVAGLAGSPAAQANVTDVAINNAVSGQWNSFAVRD